MSPARQRRVVPRTRPAALAVALLLAAFPAAASAASAASKSSSSHDVGLTVPGNQSAGDQYVETLPTTRGPRAPGRNKRAKRLFHGVGKKLQRLGGSDSAALEALATSPALGAPDNGAGIGSDRKGKGSKGTLGRPRSRESRSGGGKRHGNPASAIPSAAINAVDGGEAGLGWLVPALLAITALSLGAVGYQRHRDKGSAD